jgi:putative DNA methylase
MAYADAISVYLALAIDKSSVYWSSLCPWLNQPKNEIVGNTFGRQALPIIWDFAESNPFSDSGGIIDKQVDYLSKTMVMSLCARGIGVSLQLDAAHQSTSSEKVVSADPPYHLPAGRPSSARSSVRVSP